ncbi:MAG: hypothetical protein IPH16_04490 [Haliscomenobacter sp.]|nr:hypothetical protein [Haliscomenobacter sp.]MBK7474999.1 hypothetical protein [Haliscomenobacter sp.]
MQIPQKIQRLLDEGYNFQFAEYFGKGWSLFSQNVWGFAGFAFLNLVIQLVAGVVPVIGFIASLLITVPLNIGFFIVCWHIETRKNHEFQTFFKGFEYIGPLAAQYAIQMLASIALILPIIGFVFMDWNILEDDFPSIQPWKFALLLPLIYLQVAWYWAPMFVVFYKMNFWDALETSRLLITKKWGTVFLFLMATVFVLLLGMFGLFVGIFFTYPLMACINYAAFSDVTRLMEEEENDLTDHLIDFN